MNHVLLFVVLVIGCLTLPVLLASALSQVAGIGPWEMLILFALCVTCAFFVWRSVRGSRA